MTCGHDFETTGAVQQNFFGMEKTEKHEWRCKLCKRVRWLLVGMTPVSKAQSSARDNAARVLQNQMSLAL